MATRSLLVLLLLFTGVAGGPASNEPRTDRWDVLIAGGDTVLARWEHDMVSRNGYDWPLQGLGDLLASADAALCNLECCVSLRGEPTEKGERCPFYYRARPAMLRCLTRAGIDIVTAANNHGGDYGPISVADTLTWTTRAGLLCVGVGKDMAEAEKPQLVQIGRTRVGIAGMDTTMRYFRARGEAAGTNHAPEGKDLSAFTEKVRRMEAWARGRCDLLILTIHWGANWVKETQPVHRQMARIACAHGVDCILGHSAHRLQGIEVLDGTPVIYDMGNLLFDCKLKPEGLRSALFRLHLSRNGVRTIEVVPALALNGHSVRAGHDDAREILNRMKDLCTPLNTDLVVQKDGQGHLVGVVTIPQRTTPRRAPPDRRLACTVLPAQPPRPSFPARGRLAETIPETARTLSPPANVAPGLELCAVRLPETAREAGILTITTWWRVTAPIKAHVLPAFHLSVSGETTRRGTPWYTRHDAADWTVPLSCMKAGEIVEDCYPARLSGIPAGPCRVSAVVLDTSLPEETRIIGKPRLLGIVIIEPREVK